MIYVPLILNIQVLLRDVLVKGEFLAYTPHTEYRYIVLELLIQLSDYLFLFR